MNENPNHALIVEYDPATQSFRWALTGAIPIAALVGTLERVKVTLIRSQEMAEAQAAQQRIVPANGQLPPFRP